MVPHQPHHHPGRSPPGRGPHQPNTRWRHAVASDLLAWMSHMCNDEMFLMKLDTSTHHICTSEAAQLTAFSARTNSL